MRIGLPLALLALCAARLPAVAQTNAPPPEAPASVAEDALRDGIPSLAFVEATNALAAAESPESARHAFEVAAAALERTAPPETVLAWLDTLQDGRSARPIPSWVWFRARALSALGRHAEAAALLAPIRERLPEGDALAGPVLRDLAFALLSDGRPAEAAAALEPVAAGDPAATLDLARLLLSTGEPGRAEAILAPLAADTNAPPAVAAAAALLRLRAARDAGNQTEEHGENGEGSAGVETGDIRHSAFGIQHSDPDVPADLRALILASRAALLAPEDPASPPPKEAVSGAREARALAESPSARLDCDATLLALLARTPGGADEALGLARRLVAAAPRAPAVRGALRNAAAALLAASAPSNALAFADLHLASFADAPDEAAVIAVRAQALSALGRHGEASAAYLRAAELAAAASDAASRDEALYDAASEQHAAGLDRQAAATLERLLAADPPPPEALRARASYLAAECLVSVDPDAASAAFLALADEFPASDEGSQAVFRAAQLADAAATNAAGIGRAIDLFRRAAAPSPPPGSADAAATGADLPAGEEAALRIQAASALSIALLQQRQGDHTGALVSLKLAASTPDGGPAVEQALALLPAAYLALGRADEALAAYAVFTNAHPASAWLPDLRFWRAARSFDAGEWNEAAAQFAAFAERNAASPKAPYARYYAAVALLRAQRHREAAAAAEALAGQFPASPVLPAAAFVRAEALCQLLEFDEAALLFRGVLENPAADPALALRAAVRRADCLFALGGDAPERYDESLGAYRAALASPLCAEAGLAPECAYKAGRSLERLGRADEAALLWHKDVIDPFDKAPDAGAAPWYSRAVFDLSAVLLARGARDEAAAALRKLAGTSLPGADEAARRLAALAE